MELDFAAADPWYRASGTTPTRRYALWLRVEFDSIGRHMYPNVKRRSSSWHGVTVVTFSKRRHLPQGPFSLQVVSYHDSAAIERTVTHHRHPDLCIAPLTRICLRARRGLIQ